MTLQFTPADLVSEGGQRFIYTHADHPGLVFKLLKTRAELDLKNDLKGWSIRNFPWLVDRVVRKEYRTYVDACLAAQSDLDQLPITRMFGFAQSNLGVMQVSEKVTLDGVAIGPTVQDLHHAGEMTPARIGLLSAFVQRLAAFEIPTNDVSGRNIVLGRRNGHEQFICVDGFGDIHLVPVRTYFRRSRRDALVQRMQRLAHGLDLTFDKQTLRFIPR